MRVGVLARTNSRGLDIQTSEAARNLDATVLVVNVVNQTSRHFPSDFSRYPTAPIVDCLPGWKLDERTVRCWLEKVDVVYTAETFYDDHFTEWARTQHVATVVHANPEFVPPGGGWAIGNPTAWWSATSWRLERLPAGSKVVTFPVATDRFTPVEPHDGPCRWLHVAGKRAMSDRNGTLDVIAALALLREPCEVTICTQDPTLPPIEAPPHVKVRVSIGGVPDYWSLYVDQDALVMPRRYGGLCLPVQEAMASGMAVVMSDIQPNPGTWPIVGVKARYGPVASMPAGKIPVAAVNPHDLAAIMDTFADPSVRHARQAQSRQWADEHSWERLAPQWLTDLASL